MKMNRLAGKLFFRNSPHAKRKVSEKSESDFNGL